MLDLQFVVSNFQYFMKKKINLSDKIIEISAPGKLVLCGEHAVLYGHNAVSFAINKRIYVKIIKTHNKDIVIESEKFGVVVLYFNKKNNVPNWCNTIYFLLKKNKQNGLKIEILSDIKNYGFGSSGALFSCICCGLLLVKKPDLSKQELLNKTLDIYFEYCKKNNFNNSGIDIVTSFYGGMLCYNYAKRTVKDISVDIFKNYKFFAIYSGHKTNVDDVKFVIDNNKNSKNIYIKIGKIVDEIIKLFRGTKDEDTLDYIFERLAENQKYLDNLGLVDKDMQNIINQCKKQNVVAKISGSGLGDCVIAICKKSKKFDIKKYKKIEVKIDFNGLKYEIR